MTVLIAIDPGLECGWAPATGQEADALLLLAHTEEVLVPRITEAAA